MSICVFLFSFSFTDPATTDIYTLSLHDALPIYSFAKGVAADGAGGTGGASLRSTALLGGVAKSRPHARSRPASPRDRKSTRLNSSHSQISYAVFCLKKKKK